jgi:hypothetical protein
MPSRMSTPIVSLDVFGRCDPKTKRLGRPWIVALMFCDRTRSGIREFATKKDALAFKTKCIKKVRDFYGLGPLMCQNSEGRVKALETVLRRWCRTI